MRLLKGEIARSGLAPRNAPHIRTDQQNDQGAQQLPTLGRMQALLERAEIAFLEQPQRSASHVRTDLRNHQNLRSPPPAQPPLERVHAQLERAIQESGPDSMSSRLLKAEIARLERPLKNASHTQTNQPGEQSPRLPPSLEAMQAQLERAIQESGPDSMFSRLLKAEIARVGQTLKSGSRTRTEQTTNPGVRPPWGARTTQDDYNDLLFEVRDLRDKLDGLLRQVRFCALVVFLGVALKWLVS